jgi:deoxycytidine triphosphate deaminase
MGTLVDHQLYSWASAGGLAPFEPRLLNATSINLRVGKNIILNDQVRSISRYTRLNPMWIGPGTWFLAETLEVIELSELHEAELCLRSSASRTGWNSRLSSHVDPGWRGRLTVEFHNIRSDIDLGIYPGQELIQLRVKLLAKAPHIPYGGRSHYQGDMGVMGCADGSINLVKPSGEAVLSHG